MSELTDLKTQRASTRACITRIKNLVESSKNTLTSTELECRLGILEAYFKQLLSYQTTIDKLAEDKNAEVKTRGELEDLYCTTKSQIKALLSTHRKESTTSGGNESILVSSLSHNNLPKLKLPQFSGRYSEYPKFIGTFKQLIHNSNMLSPIEKFNHLLDCLSGSAFRAVHAFEVSEENYPKALNRLAERYDNKCLILQEHITDLFNLPKVSKNNAYQLRDLVDNVNCHLSALQSLGSYEEIANAIIVHLAHTKLDADSQAKWNESIDYSKLPSWEDCSKVLSRRCQFLETREFKDATTEPTSYGRNVNKSKSFSSNTSRGNTKATSLAITSDACLICQKTGHTIHKCPKFTEMNVTERFNEVKRLALCINCLSKGHSMKKCKSTRCRICSHPHHTMLHRFVSPTSSGQSISYSAGTSSEQAQVSTNLLSAAVQSSMISDNVGNLRDHVFLATAVVKIQDDCGCFHFARVLLDSASQINLVTENLAQKLRLRKENVNLNVSGIGEINAKVKHKAYAVVQSRLNDFEMNLNMWVLPKITDVQPENKVNISDWSIPQNLELADPQFNIPQKIDLLIGADHFFEMLSVGQIKLGEGRPTLQKTLFGWIVSGRYKASHTHVGRVNAVLLNAKENTDQSLDMMVQRFWQAEEVNSAQPSSNLSVEQIQCESIFTDKVKRLDNGRFMVKLPFKESPDKLGNSFNMALKRFTNLEKRLNRNPNLKFEYSTFLKEYLSSDHMEFVEKKDVPSVHYFMPHQCVVRPDKNTTKLRVVFDASCPTTSRLSLNDVLMTGPTVQDDLLSIIFRFRCHRWALIADITAMYRQILVYPEDRDFQYILWREDSNEDVNIYRLNTVTYGTASAPYLATRCLKQLADDTVNTYPKASEIIRHDFYVDDLITGGDTQEEILQIYREVDEILCSAQLNLRKWYSNNSEFLTRVPEASRERTIQIKDCNVIKTLGIVWEPSSDELRFMYKPVPTESCKVTKRTILSDLSRLFDPLGLINPIVVAAKIFMQELWLLNLNWDESIPQEREFRWKEFKDQLKHIENIRLPRCVFPEHVVYAELHGFSDASIRAYGCCIYLRCIDSSGNVTVRLLTAKSKVAPLRPTRSLPCLELCAAELLARLLQRVSQNFRKEYNQIYLWTDSEIVLDWLSAHPSTWKTFVCNRVSSIQELTARATWRHTNSKDNPADIVSRGSCAAQLINSDWYTGPTFLQLPSTSWPAVKPRHSSDLNVPERRKIKTILVIATQKDFLDSIYAVSSFTKNCRRFAIIRRCIRNWKCKRQGKSITTGPISAKEFDGSFLIIVSLTQKHHFFEEIRALKDNDQLPPNSCLKGLNPFVDSTLGFDLLRVGGRLKNSDLPYTVKCPLLLPKACPFVESYFVELHHQNFHAGAQALLSIVRQRFWIINGRDYARKIVKKCIHCFRYRPKMLQQIMGDLPKGRVSACLPFTHCGVDFCGPFETTYKIRGKRPYKSYIAVFVCLGTRAVHLEVVSDLTAEGFLGALKRFIGRRNLCQHLYCDNATNFVGARRQLAELREAFLKQKVQTNIVDWCASKGIEFHHIPPRSPHFGGIWEAAVKAAKGHLYRTLRSSLLTFEEFTTVTIQIEAILNSRPITALSNDPNDEQALTPAHFLNQAPLNCILEPNISNKIPSYLRRWQIVTSIQQHFWRRWSREYLVQLQQRYKWRSASRNVKVGTLVIIHEDNLPPQKWLLGRVVAAIPGADGHVRVADVRTQGKVIRRAIHKLAPLPLEEED